MTIYTGRSFAVQLIHPERRSTSPDDLASGLRLGDKAPSQRPYLALNMVSSLDGKATIEWRTKGLSTELDRQLFHHLRTQADAIMVGAGTVRIERYGRMAKSEELRDKREREGLARDPLAVVVSGRLDLPADLPLLNDPEQRVVIATGSDASLPGLGEQVEYARVGDDLPLLMARLREDTACGRSSARADRRSTRTCLPPASWTSSFSRSTRNWRAGRRP